ncbi:MAG: phosphoglycolate phosphatase [Bryobacteraceae bacterium]
MKLTNLVSYGEAMPIPCAVQALVIDLDGTLVDSADDLRIALNKVLTELGLRPIETNEIKSMIGDGVPKLLERGLIAANGDAAQTDSLLPRFLEIYQANPAALTRCYPRVIQTLEALRREDFRLAVVTNKPVVVTKKILDALSLSKFFAVVVGGDSVQKRKPDPAPVLEATRQLGVDVTQALMVGDNIHDVEAAHSAGMRCVAVTYGYHHRPPSEFNADYLINHFDELMQLVIKPISNRSEAGTNSEFVSPLNT